ncbi:o-succinylbenzoate--CoA ligase [Corynebacterium aquilae]|uniref:O-succinylbenzoic acid--CoA ligase n=1 Tax=Corynebacterium aquilae DSM 44791 TaxID=1431546 RepID=A0A1L7CDS1_9CORY|nr:o-succinylbenzoate--CoA ligase [Corynebacterium aquilae]APT83964.1 O-succinylbenzoic acid--CoA ligase [Corynebacterium aquilae DSM 44791]
MPRRLHTITFSPTDIPGALTALEEAISGAESYLPLPASDTRRADLLVRHMRPGEEISAEVALVMATSGSTGVPKGAQLSPSNLVSSADATHQFLGGAGQWVLALPPHHIAGVQVLVRSVVAGVDPVVVDVSRGFSVSAFADAVFQAPAGERLYTALVPMQLVKAMDSLRGIDALRACDAVLVGGGALHPEVRSAAEQLGIRVVETYGSSETSGGCVYDGRPIPGARVRLEGERIVLGGPMVALGYRNVPSQGVFVEPDWFVTSDAGVVRDGRLVVVGRMDAVIVTGGLKVHPEVVEAALVKIPGVRQACVVGVEDPRLGQMVVAAYEGPAAPQDVLAGLDEVERWMVPRRLLRVDALPTTGPGKVDRSKVSELF